MAAQENLQRWAEENKVKGIRFFPTNPSETSIDGILGGAYKAIQSLEEGSKIVAYKDNVDECSASH